MFESKKTLSDLLVNHRTLVKHLTTAQQASILKPSQKVDVQVNDGSLKQTDTNVDEDGFPKFETTYRFLDPLKEDETVEPLPNVVAQIDVPTAYLIVEQAHTLVKHINDNFNNVYRNWISWIQEYDNKPKKIANKALKFVDVEVFTETDVGGMLIEWYLKQNVAGEITRFKMAEVDINYKLERELNQMKAMNYTTDPVSFIQAFHSLSRVYEDIRNKWVAERRLTDESLTVLRAAKNDHIRPVLRNYENIFSTYSLTELPSPITTLNVLKIFTHYGKLAEVSVDTFGPKAETMLNNTRTKLLESLKTFPLNPPLHVREDFYGMKFEETFTYSNYDKYFNIFDTEAYKSVKTNICQTLAATKFHKLEITSWKPGMWAENTTPLVVHKIKDYVETCQWCEAFGNESDLTNLTAVYIKVVDEMKYLMDGFIKQTEIDESCKRYVHFTFYLLSLVRKVSRSISVHINHTFNTVSNSEILLIASITGLYHEQKRFEEIILPFADWTRGIELEKELANRMVIQVIERDILHLIEKATGDLNQLISSFVANHAFSQEKVYDATVVLKKYYSCLGDYRKTVPSDTMVKVLVAIDRAYTLLGGLIYKSFLKP